MQQVLSGLIDLELRPQGEATLTQQLYGELRKVMLDGTLAPGRRLPSSRELARQLKVSRNTVSGVIDQLAMEGFLDVAQGRRPVVTAQRAQLFRGKSMATKPTQALRMSQWARRLDKSDWP